MTPEKYVQLAGQLRFLLERIQAMKAVQSRFPEPKDTATFSRRNTVARLISNAGHQLKRLTINLGHSEEGLQVLAATTVAGTILDTSDIQFIRDHVADRIAYYGDDVSKDEIADASALEIEVMLPILSPLVDRLGALLVNEC